jgi:hypothetical protein
MKSHWKSLGAAIILSCAAAAVVAQSGETHTATDLHGQPQADAPKLATLAANAKVEVIGRRGGWLQVKSGTQTGWVSLFDVTLEKSTAGSGSSPSVAGRTSNSATVTTSVKGLSKDSLQSASANPAEFQKLKDYAVSKEAGLAFGKRAKLASSKLEYLAEPAATRVESPSHHGG